MSSIYNHDITTHKTMKSVVISAHGSDVDKLLSLCSTQPIPRRSQGELLVQVHACALAPGDVRVMKGDCDYFQSPGTFPYIPGGDLAGVIVEADKNSRFHPGDEVFCMIELPRPLHGLAEYAVVKEENTEWIPNGVDMVEAAALTSSALTAMLAVRQYINKGDRVLVLGGSGGVGTFFVQLARNTGASYIAATSTQKELLTSLGVNRVIDYRKEDWWRMPDYQEKPFDVIFDTVGGKKPWLHALQSKGLKRNGLYVVMNGDEPLMHVHNLWQAFVFSVRLAWRQLWTSLLPFLPNYKWHINGLDLKPGDLQELGGMAQEGNLKVVLDPSTPAPFQEEAIRRAFKLMESRHAHGKVVVQVK